MAGLHDATRSNGGRVGGTRSGRLFVLQVSSGGQLFSLDPDGTDRRTIASECGHPDGIALDLSDGYIYWTNMGAPPLNDGVIERVDLNGENRTTIVPAGRTFTPKQLVLDRQHSKLYWADREGMRIMRCDLDGSAIETLVERGQSDTDRTDQTRWCVGIALDVEREQIYWTQKGPDNAGLGRIFRAPVHLAPGESAVTRTDIEVLFDKLPEPIDLELDLASRLFYWTDRGDPPTGNTVNRASMDPPSGSGQAPEILVSHLMEGIGIALDLEGERMFVTDLAGSVYSANLDGSNMTVLAVVQGNLSGIAYADLDAAGARQ